MDTYLNACISKSWISQSCNIWYKIILMSFNFVNFAKSEKSWNISFSTRFKCKLFSSMFIVLLFSCNPYFSQAYLQFIFFFILFQVEIQFPQHSCWKYCPFPYCLGTLVEIIWPYILGFISGSCILSPWSLSHFLC